MPVVAWLQQQLQATGLTWSRAQRAKRLRALQPSPSWCVGKLQLTEGELRIDGWALAPLTGEPTTITLNGEPMEAISWGTPRPDLGRLAWHWPDSGHCGFEMQAAVDHRTLFRDGRFELAYVYRKSLQPINPRHLVYFPAPDRSHVPLPEHVRQARVQGTGSDHTFVMEGFSAFEAITSALERHSGRSRRDLGRLLDWGCGCGRLSRYFEGSHIQLTGIDIDADNAAWCATHFPFGRFFAVPLRPPTPTLESQSFDVVIGMSVMTHLTEVDQHRWLEELYRVTRPGALLALTTHGGPAIARAGLPPKLLRRFLERGFLDAGMNPDLTNAIAEPAFYRNAFHSDDYIRAQWTRHFDIIEHSAGVVGNHQDLVVLRRRPSVT